MGAKSVIQWTDASWTPIRARVRNDAKEIAEAKGYASLLPIIRPGRIGPHCERVSPGCENCYSETNNGRCLPHNGTGLPFDRRARDLVEIFLDEEILKQPLHWKKPRRIFVCSQTDLFGEFVSDAMIMDLWRIMALTPWHTYQVLTKRAQRMRDWVTQWNETRWLREFLPNVWLGISAEDQERLDERAYWLMRTEATKRFVSYEPALGPIQLTRQHAYCPEHDTDGAFCSSPCPSLRRPDWLIIGGESGPKARPFHLEWARSIISQCDSLGIKVFVKQLGGAPYSFQDRIAHRNCGLLLPQGFSRFLNDHKGGDPTEWPPDLRVREFPS